MTSLHASRTAILIPNNRGLQIRVKSQPSPNTYSHPIPPSQPTQLSHQKPSLLSPPPIPQELESLIKAAHTQGQRLRPVGSAISPNGLGLSSDGMVTLANLDQVVHMDPLSQQVRVQAGARVEQVVEALRPHNLTLQNYASVREQQIGGFIQVRGGGHTLGRTESICVKHVYIHTCNNDI